MRLSASRSAGSANTRAASALRSREPSGRSAPGNREAISRRAGRPGSTTSLATWSASTTGMPRVESMRPTVALPDPMLPVNPQIRTGRVYTALLHEVSRPAPLRRFRCDRFRPRRAGLVPHLPPRGLPHLGGEPARPGGASAHARSAPEAALLAVPFARPAARRPGRRARRLLRDLPRRWPLVPVRRGDARQGSLAIVRPARSRPADLHGLPRRPVAVAAPARSQGGDAAYRPLDRGPRGAQTEGDAVAQGKTVSDRPLRRVREVGQRRAGVAACGPARVRLLRPEQRRQVAGAQRARRPQVIGPGLAHPRPHAADQLL